MGFAGIGLGLGAASKTGLGKKIFSGIGGLFGNKKRAGESECEPCNPFDPRLNMLATLFEGDRSAWQDALNFIRLTSPKRASRQCPQLLETPSGTAQFFIFYVQGAGDCKVSGKEDPKYVRKLSEYEARARLFVVEGTRRTVEALPPRRRRTTNPISTPISTVLNPANIPDLFSGETSRITGLNLSTIQTLTAVVVLAGLAFVVLRKK